MKSKLSFFLLFGLLACIGAQAQGPQVFTTAVFNFEAKEDSMRDIGKKAADLLTVYLSNDPHIITVERTELAKIMSEEELGLSGTVSSETAAKVGHLTGAK